MACGKLKIRQIFCFLSTVSPLKVRFSCRLTNSCHFDRLSHLNTKMLHCKVIFKTIKQKQFSYLTMTLPIKSQLPKIHWDVKKFLRRQHCESANYQTPKQANQRSNKSVTTEFTSNPNWSTNRWRLPSRKRQKKLSKCKELNSKGKSSLKNWKKTTSFWCMLNVDPAAAFGAFCSAVGDVGMLIRMRVQRAERRFAS